MPTTKPERRALAVLALVTAAGAAEAIAPPPPPPPSLPARTGDVQQAAGSLVEKKATAPIATVAASPPKLIDDTTLLLDRFDIAGSGNAATPPRPACARAAQASGETSGWCGQQTIEVFNPLTSGAATAVVRLGPSVRDAGGAPTAGAIFALAGDECGVQGDSTRRTFLLAARQSCRLTVTAVTTRPGDFRVPLRLTIEDEKATSSHDQTSTIGAKARRGVEVALAWLSLGGLLGGLLAYFNGSFRTQATALESALRLRQRYGLAAALALASRLVPNHQRTLLDAGIEAEVTSARAGGSATPLLAEKVERLMTWALLAQRAAGLEAAALSALRRQFEEALAAVLAGSSDADADLAALRSEVDAAITAQQNGGGAAADIAKIEAAAPIAPPNFAPWVLAEVNDVGTLARRIQEVELLKTALSFVLFAVAALSLLWVGNLAWGTAQDILGAILAGAAAFLGADAVRGMKDAAGG